MFNEPKEPNYVTFESIGTILDGLLAEKEEQITANVVAEIRRLVAAGELEL